MRDALQAARRRAPSCSPQVTRYGSAKRSPSSPKPGKSAVEPKPSGSIARISTLSTSPGLGAAHGDRPGQRVAAVEIDVSEVGVERGRRDLPVEAVAAVDDDLVARGRPMSAGGRSGCQRLWPVSGASTSERRIGGFSSCSHRAPRRSRRPRRGSAPLGLAEAPRRAQVVDREQREQVARRGSTRSRSARACRRSARASRGTPRRRGRPRRRPPARPARRCSASMRGTGCVVRSVGSSRRLPGARRERLVGDREVRVRHVDAHGRALGAESRRAAPRSAASIGLTARPRRS